MRARPVRLTLSPVRATRYVIEIQPEGILLIEAWTKEHDQQRQGDLDSEQSEHQFLRARHRVSAHFLANVTDETRAGERGVSPFELRKMLSGDGACDLGHIPRVVLWRSG